MARSFDHALLLPRQFLVLLIMACLCVGGEVRSVLATDPGESLPMPIDLDVAELRSMPVDRKLFALNLINTEYGVAWPTIPFTSWRNFHSVWVKLEAEKGRWNFIQLDKDIALAESKRVEVMLVLGTTPTWASMRPHEKGCCTVNAPKGNAAEAQDISDWQNYVRTVVMRYKGRVHIYELWNEPNVKRFYSGSITKLVELNEAAYKVIKAADPSATVVSSSLSPCCESLSFLDKFFSLEGGQYADVIGYHFYVAPRAPEAMIDQVKQVHALMKKYGLSKPLWNTETGWRVLNHDKNIASETWAGDPLPEALAAAYMARSYVLSWAVGVERLYWYAWGHQSMGMTEYNGRTPKLVASAYHEVQNWMLGSFIRACNNHQQKTWVCELQKQGSNSSWILWNLDGEVEYSIPHIWGVSKWRDLKGEVYSLQGRGAVTIGPSPIFLQ